MDRKEFLRSMGLFSSVLVVGVSPIKILGQSDKDTVIDIGSPLIHVRHGLYNIPNSSHEGIRVQRDIFNQNGLEAMSKNRMMSIHISEHGRQTSAVWDHQRITTQSDKLSTRALSPHRTLQLDIEKPSLIFSEFGDLKINGTSLSDKQAWLQSHSGAIAITSHIPQQLFLYQLR